MNKEIFASSSSRENGMEIGWPKVQTAKAAGFKPSQKNNFPSINKRPKMLKSLSTTSKKLTNRNIYQLK